MLLIVGPPAAGKTSYCLDQLRTAIRTGQGDVRLLLPTTTMAEHLRNHLVREGFVFSPAVISTFSKFVQPFIGSTPAVSSAALELIMADLLKRLPLTDYRRVGEFPGFRRTLASAVEEVASAGGDADVLAQAGANPDLVLICSEVEAELKRRGLQFRSALLRRAALRISEEGTEIQTVIMAGFFSFTPPELEVIRAIAQRSELTIALTEWAGAQQTLAALRSIADGERELEQSARKAARIVVKAATVDGEATEIARRILIEVERGRSFREIGILVRTADPYVPALQTALERFGIPARFYFGNPLPSNATVRYLLSVVEAMLKGWEHEATLAALRLPASPLEASGSGDEFEFGVRSQLPDAGLENLRGLAPEMASLFDSLEQLSSWATATSFPSVWASRYAQLRSLVAAPRIDTPEPHERSLLWREQALALDAFDQCVEETGDALPSAVAMTCREFQDALQIVLTARTLRNIDHRRNVVHVIDAFEARQWKLAVVFVPGLLEKEFPRYHAENPVLPDPVRRRLQAAGLPLRTSTERQQDEGFLFDLALTRATDTVVLSYPELNGKGDANLPSFFLGRAGPYTEEPAVEARPDPIAGRAAEPAPNIYEEALRAYIAARHTAVAATSIESFLQCPYQFFAARTLRLREMPEAPDQRLNLPAQGSIAHKALELHFQDGMKLEDAFDTAFLAHCRAERVPGGYRTEAVRLELLHNLRLAVEDERLARGVESLHEYPFTIMLQGIPVRGKIDRIEIDAAGRAAVIDYKYRGKSGSQATRRKWDDGGLVQAGIYLLAAREIGHDPASVMYYGFKGEVTITSWSKPEELATMMRQATERTVQAAQEIAGGRIEPLARDEDKCRYCAFANACRKETYAMGQTSRRGANA